MYDTINIETQNKSDSAYMLCHSAVDSELSAVNYPET